MSGIFDLFNGTGNSGPKNLSLGPTEAARKSTTSTNFGNVAGVAGKNVDISRPKPKGLSIRSKSSLNVAISTPNGAKSPLKKSPIKSQFLNVKAGPNPRLQLSPVHKNKQSKIPALKAKQLKASKSKSPTDVLWADATQEINIFRKPLTPAKVKSRAAEMYPEPDKLAPYYDETEDLYPTIETVDEEFVKLMKISKSRVKPYTDEGFESDPELVAVANLEPVSFKNALTEDEMNFKAPSLPSLSDDEDVDFLE